MSILLLNSSAFTDSAADPQALPAEFRLLKFGANPYAHLDGGEGELVFDEESARSVMANFAKRGLDRIAIDLDHKTFSDDADQARAVGWFVPVVRPDGLYASDVKWTPEGQQLLTGKSYRFFSPTVQSDSDGRVLDLLPVALTNLPALRGIPALVAASARSQSKETPRMKIVLTKLGLAADADEQSAASAVEKLQSEHSQLLALSGKSTVAEAIGIITALKAKADQVESLTAEIVALKNAHAQAEVASLLDDAQRDGRVAPAQRAAMLELSAKHGPEALRACLSMLPKQPGQTPAHVEPAQEPKQLSATSGLSSGQLKILSKLGKSPEALMKFQREQAARLADDGE